MKKVLSLVLTGAMMLSLVACGAKKEEYRSVNVESLEGEVALERESNEAEIFESMQLIPLDKVETGAESSATLLVDADKHIVASENTELTVNAVGNTESGKVTVNLTKGEAEFAIDNKLTDDDSFEVVTPNATMSVRGTKFIVRYDAEANKTYVTVIEGTVAVSAGGVDRDVTADEAVVVSEDAGIEDYEEVSNSKDYYLTHISYKSLTNGNVVDSKEYSFSYYENGNVYKLGTSDNVNPESEIILKY